MADKFSSVSKSERRAIFLCALIPSLLVGYLFIEEGMYEYRRAEIERKEPSAGISFSHDDFGRQSPGGLLLLVPIIAAALIEPRHFWVSTSLTVLCSILFLVGIYFRIAYAREMGFERPREYAIDVPDLLFGAYLLAMLMWQYSIMRRLSAARSARLP